MQFDPYVTQCPPSATIACSLASGGSDPTKRFVLLDRASYPLDSRSASNNFFNFGYRQPDTQPSSSGFSIPD